MHGKTLRSFAALCIVPFILVLSNSLLIPVLPQIQKALNLTLFQAGLIITAFSLTAGLVIPFAGYLSDRVGRKAVMVAALAVFGLGGVLAGVAGWLSPRAFPWILAGRVLQGIGGGGTYQLAMALAGDMFTDRERSRALGYLEGANGLGKVVAPLLGSAAALIVWFAPFFVYGLLAWPAALLVWFICTEPPLPTPPPGSTYLEDLRSVLAKRGRGLAISFLAGFLGLFLLFGLLSYLADVLEKRLGIRGFSRGLLVAVPVLALTITSSTTGVYLQKHLEERLKPVLLLGLALVAVSLVALAAVPSGLLFLFPLTAAGVGTGLFLPGLNLLITSAAEGERGLVTALYGTVRFFGAALGPPALGLGLKFGRFPLFLGAAAATGLVLFLAWLLIKVNEMLPQHLAKNPGDEGSAAGQNKKRKSTRR
ncbi:MAG: transporter, family, multidrug resistance protein [Bacillota bacterium]|nr:transporter, family, multidrug resistance protein [Bacillota bacterium]MDK2855679.1 transporter, family, multidrug resistance protein [Bacillota bacterium]MDK2924903.1 transporter, family, multidrug resistance protein [Bacillota bacterium]